MLAYSYWFLHLPNARLFCITARLGGPEMQTDDLPTHRKTEARLVCGFVLAASFLENFLNLFGNVENELL